MDRVNSQMKSNVITMASDNAFKLQRVPTGSLVIDRLTRGGLARGRHVELFGDFMVCKSLIAYQTLALAQKRGEVCALVDGENVFDADWFTELGGDPKQLMMAEKGENANTLGNALRLMIQRTDEIRGVDIILIDSVASLLPREEEEHDHEAGDARVASLARLMSLLLRQLTMSNKGTLFIWTNQWRDKISRIPGLKSTPGGRSLGFYASTRIEMMTGEKEYEEIEVVNKGKIGKRKRVRGRWVNCTLEKEKTGARPFDSRSFMIDFESRKPDLAREIIDIGMEDGLVVRHGDYFTFLDDQRVHGINRAVKLINEDEEMRAVLINCIEEQTALLAAGDDG